MKIFDDNLVYPVDENGRYVEVDGYVVSTGEHLDLFDFFSVDVLTKFGTLTGYASSRFSVPNIGCVATIRIYDQGGGWYPDDKIVSITYTTGSL